MEGSTQAVPKGRELAAYKDGFVPVRLSSYREALTFGKELIDTGLLPSYIKKPSQAVAIILTGQEMGIPPMRALRTIYIVEGRPTMKAEEMLAHFRAGGGRARENESSKEVCEWQFTHPNGDEHIERVTFEEVKRIATTGQGKLKNNWASNPGTRIMLRWRCISTGLRVAAPDLFGAIYTPEEMQDVVAPVHTEHETADNVSELRQKLDAAKAEAQEPTVEVEAQETEGLIEPEAAEPPDECNVCGTELSLDNLADDGLCLDCAVKQE